MTRTPHRLLLLSRAHRALRPPPLRTHDPLSAVGQSSKELDSIFVVLPAIVTLAVDDTYAEASIERTLSMSLDIKPVRFSGFFASPLRYPGGKGRLGPWLATVIESNALNGGWYVEPYAGGAGAALYLLLKKHVEHIVINDADPLVYAFWKSVVDESLAFEDLIRKTPVTMKSRERFQEMVATPDCHPSLDVGFAAFFLNRTSRSGILAGGVIGGKKQAGAYRLDARYSHEDLIARVRAIGALRDRITVLGMDAFDLLVDCSPGFPKKSLIYLDPPYYLKGSQLYRNHYQHADHEAIARCVRHAKYPLLITYDECNEIRNLYEGMSSSSFSLQYSTHMTRPKAREVMFYANLELPAPPTLTRGAQLPAHLPKARSTASPRQSPAASI
jgi:DNA adenine methylase